MGVSEKSEHVHNVIRAAVRSNFLFRHLDDAVLREMVQKMVKVSNAFALHTTRDRHAPIAAGQSPPANQWLAAQIKVAEGHVIIKQGDKGDFFYVIESGRFSVLVNDNKACHLLVAARTVLAHI